MTFQITLFSDNFSAITVSSSSNSCETTVGRSGVNFVFSQLLTFDIRISVAAQLLISRNIRCASGYITWSAETWDMLEICEQHSFCSISFILLKSLHGTIFKYYTQVKSIFNGNYIMLSICLYFHAFWQAFQCALWQNHFHYLRCIPRICHF